MTGVVVSVEARGRDPGAGFARNRGNVEDVVEVPVGDDDAPNALMVPAALAQRPAQKEAAADKSAIEHIQPGRVSKDVKA